MKIVLLGAFVTLLGFSKVALAESYTCISKYIDGKTGAEIKTDRMKVDLNGFSSSCKSGPCKSQSHISGGNKGDSFSFSLIAHNSKPPTIGLMIMSFRLDTKPAYEGSSLAGTDYGNRLYTQVNSGDTNIFIECNFSKN
ncbi:hypothetical protein D3C87_253930 [compost metagenome]